MDPATVSETSLVTYLHFSKGNCKIPAYVVKGFILNLNFLIEDIDLLTIKTPLIPVYFLYGYFVL
jgi:hypothetical protein